MIRKIIHIDTNKCNGCGACAAACHEGAIGMIGGKAVLLRDDYCDGLGDCLPACPVDAISFVEREAVAYNEEAVQAHKAHRAASAHSGGCPGSRAQALSHTASSTDPSAESELLQWPVQIQLVPITAPYYNGARLLVAADCTAYAYGNFHHDFIHDHVTLIGCPKLDDVDYTEKLTAILAHNDIRELWITRMTVPCCGGLERAALTALKNSEKQIPYRVITIAPNGSLVK